MNGSPPTPFLPGPGTPGLVSVVIPTYNRSAMLVEALDSVLAQSYPHVEAIVVDDGSTDDTQAVLARYTDPRVVPCHQRNGGLSSARNHGLRRARGEFIAFLDSDDVWHPWKLEAQIAAMRRHPEVGLVFTDMTSFTPAGAIVQQRYVREYLTAFQRVDLATALTRGGTLADLASTCPPDVTPCPYYVGSIFDLMYAGNLVMPSTALIARARLREAGSFEPELTGPGGEDYHFYFKIAERTGAAFLDAPSILYRVAGNQMSAGGLKESRGDVTVLTHWLARHRPDLPAALMRRRIAGAHAWRGQEAMDGGEPGEAIRSLFTSLRVFPLQPRTALLLLVALLPDWLRQRLRHAKRGARSLVRAQPS